jgi:uroporphyrin-III C-methyltransferase
MKSSSATLGKVYLVGAGPGAADLITVRGAKLLAMADIVFHDALVEEEMLAYCPQALKIAVGKRCGKHSTAQKFINKRLVDAAQKYQVIVRLKGGDPMIFGRADEEMSELEAAGVEAEVVPGITAALAAAASLKQSLTLRGVARSVAFSTQAKATDASGSSDSINLPLPTADTVVIYMGRNEAVSIAEQLIAQGRLATTPVRIVESISTKRERSLSLTLADMANGLATDWFDGQAPALLLVGAVFSNRLENAEILTNGRLSA